MIIADGHALFAESDDDLKYVFNWINYRYIYTNISGNAMTTLAFK